MSYKRPNISLKVCLKIVHKVSQKRILLLGKKRTQHKNFLNCFEILDKVSSYVRPGDLKSSL